jgi:hypothetical protein
VFKVCEGPIDRITRRRLIEPTTKPDHRFLEFSCDRMSDVDVLIIPLEETLEEFWWPVNRVRPCERGRTRRTPPETRL